MDLFDRIARPRSAESGGRSAGGEGPTETLEGTVERIVFSGGGGEFTVARLSVEGAGEPVTVVGSLLGIPVGARLRVTGRREQNPRFGPQLRVTGYTEMAPATLEGVRRYLGSGLVKGIGPEFASRIVARFGIETLAILDRAPGRISEVPGIGPARARAIRDAWSAQREVRNVMVFLQGHGVSPAFAARIFKRYGASAIALVRENPYRLAFDVWGIGFLSADKLAAALGIGRESDARVEAGVRHVLEEASSDGHIFAPREGLVRAASMLLDVAEEHVHPAIERLARVGDVVIEAALPGGEGVGAEEAIYTAALHRAEVAVAAGLKRLMASAPTAAVGAPSLDVQRALEWYQSEAKIELAAQQADAVRRALTEPVLVVTGGPGVGKTTIVRGIVSILMRKGCRVALAAPTGRAAKRLSEATGQPAATLHRMLEWRPADSLFGRSTERPLETDVLVVDEASMLDVRLAADLLAALAPGTRLVLVGDVDQLPSVGPGTVLRDVIASGAVPTVRLTEIFRQAGRSQIVLNAHRIHDGELPETAAAPSDGGADARDFFFLEEDDPAAAALLIRDLVTVRLPRRYGFHPHEVQVLAPMHRGELGAGNLNLLLQAALTAGGEGVSRGGRAFHVGDRVMQVRNDYDKEVFNGDIGRVERIAHATEHGGEGGGGPAAGDGDGQGQGQVIVRFDDREVPYGMDELDELRLAYAATVHKAQGSEFPAVIIPVHTQHYVMLQRNLLYTAVTRARKLVVLVGTRRAVGLAVRNAEIAQRASRLASRLATWSGSGTTGP